MYVLSLICFWRSKFLPLSKPVFLIVCSPLGLEQSPLIAHTRYKAANAITVCLILSRLDFCDSLLAGLPQTRIKRSLAIQNSAARIVVRQGKRDHREFHWLPVRDRIHHKLFSVTYCSVHENLPLYLSELIPAHTPPRFLRSASELFLAVPVPRTVKQSDMASESSDVSPLPNGMLCPRASGSQTIYSFRSTFKTPYFSL